MDKRFIPAVIAAAQAGRSAYRVPASVTLAQWALESRYGEAMPKGSNNPFGIKAKAGEPYVESMTWEFEHGARVNKTQRFRKFDTLPAAFEAHVRLLATSHFYTKAMMHCDRPDAFANALTGVYATDPVYGSKLISIMKANNLYAFDGELATKLPPPIARIDQVAVTEAVPPKTAAAPVAAAPAHPPATAKAKTMTADIKAALPGVDFFTGIVNQAEALAAQLSRTLVKAADPKDSTVTVDGHNVVSASGGIVGTISNVKSAIGKINEIVSDAKKKDVQEAVADGVDLGSIVFATLDTYKIDLPVVTGIFLSKPNLHSGGVDKTA